MRQLWDVLANGYWHARRLTFLMSGTFHTLEWVRILGDAVFLLFGVVPILMRCVRSRCGTERERRRASRSRARDRRGVTPRVLIASYREFPIWR